MGYSPPHRRMKEKYNPTPNARERAFHVWLIEEVPCVNTGMKAQCVHHPLMRHPAQRWRRDHEFVVPMTDAAHKALHGEGSEAKFDPDQDYAQLAWEMRERGIAEGLLYV